MHRRSIGFIAALTMVSLLGGCVQSTRHSNTMIFGTNTSFGIKVGTTTAQVPTIIVGYDRQEAVIMPLVANTAEKGDVEGRLSPCDVTATGGDRCLLVGSKGDSKDIPSVLASFGAEFDAGGGASNQAKGGLAQYFSTGMAAQILATTGGAAVVSTGKGTEKAAEANVGAANAVPTLFGRPFGTNEAPGFTLGERYAAFDKKLRSKIAEADASGTLTARIVAFENRIVGINTSMRVNCGNLQSCLNDLSVQDPYFDLFSEDTAAKFEAEVDKF